MTMRVFAGTLLVVAGVMLDGCAQSRSHVPQPAIEFTRVPEADKAGRDKHDVIEGRVKGALPGQRIVLYARTGSAWWAQPLLDHPFTNLERNGNWRNETHLGTQYAALLVGPDYQPALTTEALPRQGGPVLAAAMTDGQKSSPSVFLQFSGYDWRVRNAPSDRGGHRNLYLPANVWTDPGGALHLRIAKSGSEWTCAEVNLTRSLGYGTYSFVVRDISQLDPAAVFGIFTWDFSGTDPNHRELDIEISRWGDPASRNAQYLIQPYYVPSNVSRFLAPAGELTHSFVWEPGRLSFKTVRGAALNGRGPAIAQHVFTAGVPTPGIESVRMNLYVFVTNRSNRIPLQKGAEVVVEKFEYLP